MTKNKMDKRVKLLYTIFLSDEKNWWNKLKVKDLDYLIRILSEIQRPVGKTVTNEDIVKKIAEDLIKRGTEDD
jgi:hypothetical protein